MSIHIGIDTEALPGVTIEQESDITEMVVPYEDPEDTDEERLTHIISPVENPHLNFDDSMTAQDVVDLARSAGEVVEALCGHRWIPKHNPDKFPVCQACMDCAASILREGGE